MLTFTFFSFTFMFLFLEHPDFCLYWTGFCFKMECGLCYIHVRVCDSFSK